MIDAKLSRQTWGNHPGMNRITVGKILKELKEKEIVELVNGRHCTRKSCYKNRFILFISPISRAAQDSRPFRYLPHKKRQLDKTLPFFNPA